MMKFVFLDFEIAIASLGESRSAAGIRFGTGVGLVCNSYKSQAQNDVPSQPMGASTEFSSGSSFIETSSPER